MGGVYFPKYNLLLLNGKNIFINAYECFLEKAYILQLYKVDSNNVSLDCTPQVIELLISCLQTSVQQSHETAQLYIRNNKIYCNIVTCFSLTFLQNNLEIFKYLSKDTVFKYTNKFIKSKKNKKYYFFIDNNLKSTVYQTESDIVTESTPTSKLKDVLNIINFNLS